MIRISPRGTAAAIPAGSGIAAAAAAAAAAALWSTTTPKAAQ